jgi:hypothetical protein
VETIAGGTPGSLESDIDGIGNHASDPMKSMMFDLEAQLPKDESEVLFEVTITRHASGRNVMKVTGMGASREERAMLIAALETAAEELERNWKTGGAM